MSKQSTNYVFLVKPANFGFNLDTASSNAFQNKPTTETAILKANAIKEFDEFAKTLTANGVNVTIFEDSPSPIKPDAIFPNNWISLHEDGKVIIYPMFAPNRRTEVNETFIKQLSTEFEIKEIIDLRHYEQQNIFLEGTGSIIFDHVNKVAYACLSDRTNKSLFEEVCKLLDYKPISFTASDKNGKPIYHTNVMLCVGSNFATICLESIKDENEKRVVIDSFNDAGLTVVDICYNQLNHFAGNMLELLDENDVKIIALSKSAYNCLTPEQKEVLSAHAKLLPLCIPTIETIGGGSARCMIAQIFLKKKG
jgi:hypothetical protein